MVLWPCKSSLSIHSKFNLCSQLLAQIYKSNGQFTVDVKDLQDNIFRRKRLSTGANFVHVYIEIWDKGILKFNTFSM